MREAGDLDFYPYQRNGAMTSARLAALFVVGALAAPSARTAQDPKPITESVTAKATIEAIDQTSKKITLKGEKGNFVEVDASALPRFDQLKVGDVVTATYTESLAVHVRQPGEPAPSPGSDAVTRRSGAPGGTVAQQRTVTVTIQAIDSKTPSVTIKTADGRVLTFRVENPKNLEKVKVGDTVDVTYTEALLLKADPAPK
jgi:Cu/Ag efflux protein CusF